MSDSDPPPDSGDASTLPAWRMPAPPPVIPRVGFRLRVRLSLLWFLEWAITGAILTYLPLYFAEKGFNADQTAGLLAVGAVGLWVAPFVVGYLCDRFVNTERYLAASHTLGGVLLLAVPTLTNIYNDGKLPFWVLLVTMGLYAAAYFPTIPLASSLTFRHLPHPDSQFGRVRLWGTVGWVTSGIALSLWLGRADAYAFIVTHLPDRTPTLEYVVGYLTWLPRPDSSDCFTIAALLSFTLAWFSDRYLPATPPIPKPSGGGAGPLEVFRLFKRPTFRYLIGISFLLSIVITFYTLEAPRMLERAGVNAEWVPAVMTVGQISEFPALILLPVLLLKLGLKGTFALGILAWLVRYGLFAFSPPLVVLLCGVALHGICHVCLVIVIQLYIDREAGPQVKASAQNLFAFVTMGVGLPLGFVAGGWLAQASADPNTGLVRDNLFFGLPALLLLVLLGIFWKSSDLSATPTATEPSAVER